MSYARNDTSSPFSTDPVTGSGRKVKSLSHMESLSYAAHNMPMPSDKDLRSGLLDTEKRRVHNITLTRRYAHTGKSCPCNRLTYH